MTAIKTNSVEGNDRRRALRPQSFAHEPQTLARAQSRFVGAVREGVDELISRCGYSRARATITLLRELGRGDAQPTDDEVFETMTVHGMGMEDALQVLTVSRALGQAMYERGLSAVQAIDHLTSKLSVTKLLLADVEEGIGQHQRAKTPENRLAMSAPSGVGVDRNLGLQRSMPASARKASVKSVHKNGKQKVPSKTSTSSKHPNRKRSAPNCEESKQGENLNSSSKYSARARADSVADVVEAKVSKKARLSDEDTPNTESAQMTIPANPVMVRVKRSVTHRGDDSEPAAT